MMNKNQIDTFVGESVHTIMKNTNNHRHSIKGSLFTLYLQWNHTFLWMEKSLLPFTFTNEMNILNRPKSSWKTSHTKALAMNVTKSYFMTHNRESDWANLGTWRIHSFLFEWSVDLMVPLFVNRQCHLLRTLSAS